MEKSEWNDMLRNTKIKVKSISWVTDKNNPEFIVHGKKCRSKLKIETNDGTVHYVSFKSVINKSTKFTYYFFVYEKFNDIILDMVKKPLGYVIMYCQSHVTYYGIYCNNHGWSDPKVKSMTLVITHKEK